MACTSGFSFTDNSRERYQHHRAEIHCMADHGQRILICSRDATFTSHFIFWSPTTVGKFGGFLWHYQYKSHIQAYWTDQYWTGHVTIIGTYPLLIDTSPLGLTITKLFNSSFGIIRFDSLALIQYGSGCQILSISLSCNTIVRLSLPAKRASVQNWRK